jgi:hypothetical protein
MLYKNMCKKCDNNNRRVVRRLKRIYKKPAMGTQCEIQNCTNTNLCLDHDHKCDIFRGWICAQHNAAIGAMNDSYEGVQMVLDYLQACNKVDHSTNPVPITFSNLNCAQNTGSTENPTFSNKIDC